jgi:hypothetical protein
MPPVGVELIKIWNLLSGVLDGVGKIAFTTRNGGNAYFTAKKQPAYFG